MLNRPTFGGHIITAGCFYNKLIPNQLEAALVLMCRSEEVEDNLHRVECSQRNLNEECVPVAHGAVPETWKLEGLEFAALIAL